MERLERAAVIVSLAAKLRDGGSWCGETHLQKGTYFLQHWLEVPLGFDFILYKHGPFSFDLGDELSWMRANDLLKLAPQRPPYGPKLIPGENAQLLKRACPKPIGEHAAKVQEIAEKFAPMDVRKLERYATAYYVSREHGEEDDIAIASKIVALKPHISQGEAQEAVEFVGRLRSDLPNG